MEPEFRVMVAEDLNKVEEGSKLRRCGLNAGRRHIPGTDVGYPTRPEIRNSSFKKCPDHT
jgi:hypothetical protein